ncbi:MAG: M61 family metallopeptidase [Phycisphaerales bacterium]|nr:M61 family metallopeptidase [Phycisphaerales bacterium]
MNCTKRLMLAMLLWSMPLLCGCASAQPDRRTAAEAAGPARVEYTVRLDQPQTQMVDISMIVRGWEGGALEFHLPVWRPGRYVVLDLAGGVRDVRATGARGGSLAVEKLQKASWKIAEPGRGDIRIDYRIYANSLADRTRHVDSTHAFLSGTAVFMYIHELRGAPAEVRIEAPEGWRTATGLEPAGENRFRAADYDVLVDSPLEIGRHDLIEFEVDGVPHEIAIWGAGDYKRERLKEDFARIVEQTALFFGDMPYTRYVFLLHLTPRAGGGTEHLNSTIMQTSPGVFDAPGTYRNFLGLVSHEFFHTWNVKQLRPAGIKPYDYQRENYTDLLWIAEGTTTYYEHIILTRAGLMEPKTYFEAACSTIRDELARPGGAVQSVADSSFDAWIKFGRPSPDAVNSTVSFYSKGELVNLVLDMEIRRTTGNRVSLDTVMVELYRRFPLDGPGYTRRDVLMTLADLTGRDYREFFDRYISGTDALPLEESLLTAGLRLEREQKKRPEGSGEESREPAYTGLKLKDADGFAVVTAVLSDGPAYGAGMNADDQIVALNGRRLRAGDLDARLKKVRPGEKVRLTFLRADELREIEFEAGEKSPAGWTLKHVKEPTEEQRAVYESWLGQAWPGAEKAENDNGRRPGHEDLDDEPRPGPVKEGDPGK